MNTQTASSQPAVEELVQPASVRLNLLDAEDAGWRELICSHEQANFFHHPLWMRTLQACYGYRPLVAALPGVSAGLPIMQIGRRWVSLPFSDHCIPLAKNQVSLEKLGQALGQAAREQRISSVELRWDLGGLTGLHPGPEYALFVLDLDPDPEKTAHGFDRIHRQNIRTAEKGGVTVRWGSELEDMRAYYLLQLETRRRHGVPGQPWRYFSLLFDKAIRKGYGSVLLASHEGQVIAGLVLLHWGQTVIAKYAASLTESRNLRPNNLLFAHAIRWSCENGYRLFDMGRTDLDNDGLRRFKRDWGARESRLQYWTYGRKPSNRMSRLMPVVQAVLRRAPLWVVRVAGEWLYRYFG